jgi:hypothetical protein
VRVAKRPGGDAANNTSASGSAIRLVDVRNTPGNRFLQVWDVRVNKIRRVAQRKLNHSSDLLEHLRILANGSPVSLRESHDTLDASSKHSHVDPRVVIPAFVIKMLNIIISECARAGSEHALEVQLLVVRQ